MKGTVSISRNSNDLVRIELHDRASGLRFAELELTLSAFAQAITGLSRVEGELTVRGLEHVGKKLEVERRQILCPLKSLNKQALSDWLMANASEDGWHIDRYLGSQGSIRETDEGTLLSYTVRRYLEPTDA